MSLSEIPRGWRVGRGGGGVRLRTASTDQSRPSSAARSGVVIETARLRIRSLRDDDLADLVALIDNWEVASWVSSVPHPYTEADGREGIACVQQNHATGRPLRFIMAWN